MTIKEAIKHCEEKAEELEKRVKPYQCESINKKLYEVNKKEWNDCLECAAEHRQLAEWLRALKEIWDSGDCNDCLHQNNCTIRPQLGQMVRYNCYQYERKIQNDNADN